MSTKNYEGYSNINKKTNSLLTYQNGDVYNGEMKLVEAENGEKSHKRHGKGTMAYSNGDKYEGEWVDDKRHGKGVLITKTGSIFDAVWSNDEMEGLEEISKNQIKCQYKYKSGDYYEGQMKFFGPKEAFLSNFKQLRKNGKGKLIDKEGNVHEGEWKDDKKDGSGTIYYKNGDIFQGYWINGELFGHGTHYYTNGTSQSKFYELPK